MQQRQNAMAKLWRATVALFLFAGGMAIMQAQADASTATPPQAARSALRDVRLPPGLHSTTSPSSTSATPSPSNPVDPGTGETKEAKDTRVEYAPYVIAAVIVVVIVASVIFWRGRKVSHPRKSG
jgi:hypothetical protein